eukprot:11915172-Prorocentrum_lima.AAC.1
MITRAKSKDPEHPEGSYYVGQGAYTPEVLDRFSSSMDYKGRTTPGSLIPSPRTRRHYLKMNQ